MQRPIKRGPSSFDMNSLPPEVLAIIVDPQHGLHPSVRSVNKAFCEAFSSNVGKVTIDISCISCDGGSPEQAAKHDLTHVLAARDKIHERWGTSGGKPLEVVLTDESRAEAVKDKWLAAAARALMLPRTNSLHLNSEEAVQAATAVLSKHGCLGGGSMLQELTVGQAANRTMRGLLHAWPQTKLPANLHVSMGMDDVEDDDGPAVIDLAAPSLATLKCVASTSMSASLLRNAHRLVKLHSFVVDDTYWDCDATFAKALGSVASLREIDAGDTPMGSDVFEELARSASLPGSLKRLKMSIFTAGDLPAFDRALARLTALEELHMSASHIWGNDEPTNIPASIGGLSRMRALTLERVSFDVTDARVIDGLMTSSAATLEKLAFIETTFRPGSMMPIAQGLSKPLAMKELVFNNVYVHAEVQSELGSFGIAMYMYPSLRSSLEVLHVRVDDYAIPALGLVDLVVLVDALAPTGHGSSFPRLKRLAIVTPYVDSTMLERLSESLGDATFAPALEHLDLSGAEFVEEDGPWIALYEALMRRDKSLQRLTVPKMLDAMAAFRILQSSVRAPRILEFDNFF